MTLTKDHYYRLIYIASESKMFRRSWRRLFKNRVAPESDPVKSHEEIEDVNAESSEEDSLTSLGFATTSSAVSLGFKSSVEKKSNKFSEKSVLPGAFQEEEEDEEEEDETCSDEDATEKEALPKKEAPTIVGKRSEFTLHMPSVSTMPLVEETGTSSSVTSMIESLKAASIVASAPKRLTWRQKLIRFLRCSSS